MDRRKISLIMAGLILANVLDISAGNIAFASKAAKKIETQRKSQQFLDEVWLRLSRTWNNTQPGDKYSDFAPVAITFQIDKNGAISDLTFEQNNSGAVVKNQLSRILMASAPFPALKPKSKKAIKLRCLAQAHNGWLFLSLQLPDESDANSQAIADKQDPTEELVVDLQNTQSEIKVNALKALQKLGPKAAPALHQLLLATSSKDRAVSYGAWEALIAIGAPAKEILPDLIKLLAVGNGDARRAAPEVIAAIGSGNEEAAPALLRLLDSDDYSTKKNAAMALRTMTPELKQKAIQVLMSDYKEYVTSTTEILAAFGQDALPYLIKGIAEGDDYTCLHSVETLKGLRADAEPAIPALMKLVEDHVGGEVENRAIETLGDLGPAAKCAVPLLTKAAESGGEDISWRAVDALGNIGPDAVAALPTLQKLLNSNNSYLVRRVKEANLKIAAPQSH